MSTLKVNKIQHNSGVDAMTLASNGMVEFAGSVRFDPTSNVAFDVSGGPTLLVDVINDRVGILTGTPQTALDVNGTITGSSLTDGTLTLNGGSLSGTGTLGSGVTPYVATSATSSNFKVPFVNHTGTSSGNYALLQDSTSTFTYNPSTDTLTVGVITVSTSIGTGDLTVSGDLTVNGTTSTINSDNINVANNLIELNSGLTAGNPNDSGIIIERGSSGDNAFIGWDESADQFILGTTTATGDSIGDLSITAQPLQVSSVVIGGTTYNSSVLIKNSAGSTLKTLLSTT